MNKDLSGNKFCVYLHTRPDTGAVFYVGIGTKRRPNRGTCRNNYWQNVVNKNNGKFIVEVICKDISRESACQMEVAIIAYYGRSDNGTGILTNLTDGGEGTVGVSEEAAISRREKMAKLRKNPEYQKRLSDSHKGRVVSPETRDKIRSKLTGRVVCDEARRNMGLVKKGLILSDEALIKRFSVIVRRRGWVIDQIEKETNNIIQSFANIQTAAKAVGVSNGVVFSSMNQKMVRSRYKWVRNYDISVIEKVLESYTLPLKIEAA